MAAIRIITNNAADRATISVAGTAAGMGSDKLKTDIKGEVCRVLASSLQYEVLPLDSLDYANDSSYT